MKLYRKRIIPEETVLLRDDIILYSSNAVMITRWETLKAKQDFKYGFSCYFFEEGYKISKVFNENKEFVYTYCDIISAETGKDETVVLDLLADVLIEPSGLVKVLDLDELTCAYEKRMISLTELLHAINTLDKLLKIIYSNNLPILTKQLDGFIKEQMREI